MHAAATKKPCASLFKAIRAAIYCTPSLEILIYEEHHNSFNDQLDDQMAALYSAVSTAAAAPEHGSPLGQVLLSALTYQPRNGVTVFTCDTE
jgi:hypothetical protein